MRRAMSTMTEMTTPVAMNCSFSRPARMRKALRKVPW